jgi:hypothetical protein
MHTYPRRSAMNDKVPPSRSKDTSREEQKGEASGAEGSESGPPEESAVAKTIHLILAAPTEMPEPSSGPSVYSGNEVPLVFER